MSFRPVFISPKVFILAFLGIVSGSRAESLLKPTDRILFIGDSITGRGGNAKQGWVALIGEELRERHPDNGQTLVPLGGSGQTVSSWKNIEKSSRATSTILDVKAFDVQAELGRPADVLVIMLGMNDVLGPYLRDTEEGYQKWIGDYRSLIAALRERCSPRVIALALPTPCTEDPRSPKNKVMDEMCLRLAVLAAEEKCVLLPTREASWEVLEMGRRVTPDFHIAGDQVHPDRFGHVGIAVGMLRGLGENKAAAGLLAKADSVMRQGQGEPLSYEIEVFQASFDGGKLRLRIRAFHSAGDAQLELPDGWTVVEALPDGKGTVFVVEGRPDRLKNHLVLRWGGRSRDIMIPAPWLVGTANIGRRGWKSGSVFDPEAGRVAADEVVRTGRGWDDSVPPELEPGTLLNWRPFVGGVNYGGAGAPGVVDFAAITYFAGGEFGYGLRWIHSDKERPVLVKVGRPGFAGTAHLEAWLNGEAIYTGNPEEARNREFPSTLKAGWNLLSFKSSFAQWLWQLAIDLNPVEGDNLDDLRFSIVRPATAG